MLLILKCVTSAPSLALRLMTIAPDCVSSSVVMFAGCGVSPTGVIVTAIRSFFRFVSYEEPAHSAQIQRVLAVPSKRQDRRIVHFLTRLEIEDGRYVAFRSLADNLVATDTNGTADVFVHDLQTVTTRLVSVNTSGTDSGNLFSSNDGLIGISANGQFVAFDSAASNLVSTDNNNKNQIFVRDIVNDITTLASVSQDGTASGNNSSDNPRLSDDGCKVVFQSFANGDVPLTVDLLGK